MKRNRAYAIVLFTFFLITTFLAFNRHSRSGIYNYHSQIWADKAGYYMYLPATFKYRFDASQFPDSIDVKTGDGFTIDRSRNKVVTKYTSGVAIMQLPFYLLADLLAEPLGFKRDGFSQIYHWSIDLSASFYLALGMFFLWLFLEKRYKPKIVLLTLASLFLATNLLYYVTVDSGLSHVYSFALFAFSLYFFQKTKYLQNSNFATYLKFGLSAGLIALIRPTGVLFLTCFLFLDVNKLEEVKDRLLKLVNFKAILPLALGAFVIILPQLLYWNDVFGSYVAYSYQDEGFNWLNPQIASVFFQPYNGLFLYTPLYLLVLISIVAMIRKRVHNGIYLLALFTAITYVFASWDSWWFGCAFGARSYVEYLTIFSIPLSFALSKVFEAKKWVRSALVLTLLLFAAYNLKMIYSFGGCFYGSKCWDWPAYVELLLGPTK